MAMTKYTMSEAAIVTSTVNAFLTRVGKVQYVQLTEDEREKLREELEIATKK